MASKSSSSTDTPPQKSSWPWSGRKRRNSETSLSSLRELVTGRRNSLSAADAPEVNRLRKKAPGSSAAKPRAPEDKTDVEKVAAAPAGPGDAKNKSKSQSRSGSPLFPDENPKHQSGGTQAHNAMLVKLDLAAVDQQLELSSKARENTCLLTPVSIRVGDHASAYPISTILFVALSPVHSHTSSSKAVSPPGQPEPSSKRLGVTLPRDPASRARRFSF
ncbi:hypothetical protein N657DRAFT_630949 [Parathielavia appendiculata]|uniref:Uncharacterized protein n=1 Tax=Parathielavia appendiculata TaxID=2587402 RepID=A0AAN6U617_9PEZI|nr:hypothetical protein N657DRAFT_630949 [Parathielavia appendiculata]